MYHVDSLFGLLLSHSCSYEWSTSLTRLTILKQLRCYCFYSHYNYCCPERRWLAVAASNYYLDYGHPTVAIAATGSSPRLTSSNRNRANNRSARILCFEKVDKESTKHSNFEFKHLLEEGFFMKRLRNRHRHY